MNGVRPRLVLVTGAPASGKTTLADRLGPALCLPVLSRDRLKALLADALPEPAAADMALLRQTHVTLFFDLVADLTRFSRAKLCRRRKPTRPAADAKNFHRAV